jgi:hypothetical protein
MISRRIKSILCAAAVSAVSFSPAVQAATYTATDLTPSGFSVLVGNGNPNPKAGYFGTLFAGEEEVLNGHYFNATIWNANGTTPTNIHPSAWTESHALATSLHNQVGYGINNGSNSQHALLWINGAATDLHPTTLLPAASSSSQATGISLTGNHQIGYGVGFTNPSLVHAFLWNNTVASALDLNPSNLNYYNTYGTATTDTQQVGYGNGPASGFQNHALVWNGTNVAIDLHPTALSTGSSQALGTDGTHQAGYVNSLGASKNETHAYVWTGTIASGIDLNPAGFSYSQANNVLGNFEVGQGYGAGTSNQYHALLWNNSAGSVVDLQAMLPAKFQNSWATQIDASGNVFGFAFDPASGTHAVEWTATLTATPEPASFSLLILTAAGLLMRRRR